MITYDESLQILKAAAESHCSGGTEETPLLQAVGRVLAEDIFAREMSPPFDNSAMDGFAVNVDSYKNILRSGKDVIPVQSLVSAGDGDFSSIKKQGAIEIMTGAPIPSPYFDAVVRVEDVVQTRDEIGNRCLRISQIPVVGENIRRSGEDSKIGSKLLAKGQKIINEHILVLATQGIEKVKVKERIKVGILSTGKEIVGYESKTLGPGQIRNSTGVYLEAALSAPIYDVKNYGIIQDDQSIYIRHLKAIFEDENDILISTGAVSMGVYDFVRPALESIGAKIHFHKCAIRPGKPILFASFFFKEKTRFIFGIPGNPISTAVGLKFFLKPFVDLLFTGSVDQPIKVKLESDTKKPLGLKCFFKAKLKTIGEESVVEALPGQASFMVSPLAHANAWVVFPEEGSIVEKGTKVEVYTL